MVIISSYSLFLSQLQSIIFQMQAANALTSMTAVLWQLPVANASTSASNTAP